MTQFERLPGAAADEPPLIFHLLVGYFHSKPERLHTLGLFRVTSVDENLREVEFHLNYGNLNFLQQIEDPHLVTNYWKRLLRSL